jgi:hypothetical protein
VRVRYVLGRASEGIEAMTLTMRKTGLESAAYADDTDYTVYSGKWPVGRIYEDRSSQSEIRWYWTLFGPHAGPDVMRKDGREATLHDAKVWRTHTMRDGPGVGRSKPIQAHLDGWKSGDSRPPVVNSINAVVFPMSVTDRGRLVGSPVAVVAVALFDDGLGFGAPIGC